MGIADVAIARTSGDALLTGGDAAAVWSQIVSIGLAASDLCLQPGMTLVVQRRA